MYVTCHQLWSSNTTNDSDKNVIYGIYSYPYKLNSQCLSTFRSLMTSSFLSSDANGSCNVVLSADVEYNDKQCSTKYVTVIRLVPMSLKHLPVHCECIQVGGRGEGGWTHLGVSGECPEWCWLCHELEQKREEFVGCLRPQRQTSPLEGCSDVRGVHVRMSSSREQVKKKISACAHNLNISEDFLLVMRLIDFYQYKGSPPHTSLIITLFQTAVTYYSNTN